MHCCAVSVSIVSYRFILQKLQGSGSYDVSGLIQTMNVPSAHHQHAEGPVWPYARVPVEFKVHMACTNTCRTNW